MGASRPCRRRSARAAPCRTLGASARCRALLLLARALTLPTRPLAPPARAVSWASNGRIVAWPPDRVAIQLSLLSLYLSHNIPKCIAIHSAQLPACNTIVVLQYHLATTPSIAIQFAYSLLYVTIQLACVSNLACNTLPPLLQPLSHNTTILLQYNFPSSQYHLGSSPKTVLHQTFFFFHSYYYFFPFISSSWKNH